MALEVEITEARPQPAAVVKLKQVKMEDIAESMEGIYPKVMAYLQKEGIQPAGPPFALYEGEDPGIMDMDVGFPLREPVKGEGDVEPGALPGGKVAATWHIGPYETIGETWSALDAWIKENGHTPAGPGWELYMTDPQQEPDPAKWRTQILWLIE